MFDIQKIRNSHRKGAKKIANFESSVMSSKYVYAVSIAAMLTTTALIVCAFFFAAVSKASASAPNRATSKRDERVAYIAHLIGDARYAEAAQGVEQLFIDFPNDAGSYETRGILELHVGAFKQAREDFEYARTSADSSDPLPAYGLALTGMFLGDNDTASKMIDTTEAIASPEEKDDLIVLKASLASAQGDYANAIKLASQSQSSTAAEIAALCSYQEDRDTGVALIERFLESSSSNKVPRVVEDCGLRYTGPMGHMDSVLEPSLTETVLQSMFAHNLSYKNETTALGDSNIVMGAVGVGPQGNIDGLAGSGDVVVTTSVDDHLVGMVNSSPYRITWDTRKVSNGKHVLKFDISNVAGTVLQTQYKKLTVANPGAEALATSAPFSEQLEEQLWGLLKIHPAYKAAEWTLYSAYNNRRDRNHSETHLIVAAALDSAYHDSGAKVEDLFRNSSYGKLMVASSQLIKIVSNKKNEFWRGSQNLKEVALTFDDGPSPLVSPTLLDNLKRANAPGTFFVVGIRCTAAPDLVSRMHNEGHEVENHTYSHPNLDQAIPQHIMEEYLRNGVIIHSLTGRWPRFLRPPGGNSNPYVMSIAQKCGMIGGFWTVDAIRAEDTGSPQQVANYVIQKARPGAIILMHNGDQATANAIPELVAGLKAKGFKCVTLSQLARDSGVSLP